MAMNAQTRDNLAAQGWLFGPDNPPPAGVPLDVVSEIGPNAGRQLRITWQGVPEVFTTPLWWRRAE